MAGRRVADWRLPTEKPQRAERMARKMQGGALDRSPVDKAPSVTRAAGPADDTPDAYWNALLCDPRANVALARSRYRYSVSARLCRISLSSNV